MQIEVHVRQGVQKVCKCFLSTKHMYRQKHAQKLLVVRAPFKSRTGSVCGTSWSSWILTSAASYRCGIAASVFYRCCTMLQKIPVKDQLQLCYFLLQLLYTLQKHGKGQAQEAVMPEQSFSINLNHTNTTFQATSAIHISQEQFG